MNQLDATAVPMDVFQDKADLRPYKATLPDLAANNLSVQQPRDERSAYWMKQTRQQNLTRADLANPRVLNEIIWFSVRGNQPMPRPVELPVFNAIKLGATESEGEDKER